MNYRLLSDTEKLANARGRNCRNAQRQWRRRRECLLGKLSRSLGDGLACSELISAADSANLLFGHLIRARHVADRIRRLGCGGDVGDDEPKIERDLPCIGRPMRVLREDRRSQICPWLLATCRPISSIFSVAAALAAARRLAAHGESPHRLLDSLACASGIPWEAAAAILYREGLLPTPFLDIEIETIRRARLFWDRYDLARVTYYAMVEVGEISGAQGDWAFADARSLSSLFPGIKVHRALRRMAYLVNLVGSGVALCADFHAFPSRLPLFCHPL